MKLRTSHRRTLRLFVSLDSEFTLADVGKLTAANPKRKALKLFQFSAGDAGAGFLYRPSNFLACWAGLALLLEGIASVLTT